jgi:hypothetical protein
MKSMFIMLYHYYASTAEALHRLAQDTTIGMLNKIKSIKIFNVFLLTTLFTYKNIHNLCGS